MSDAANHIRGFLERYKAARQANSKEIRLTISEAEQLSVSLGIMLSREGDLLRQVNDLQQRALSDEIRQDGGSF